LAEAPRGVESNEKNLFQQKIVGGAKKRTANKIKIFRWYFLTAGNPAGWDNGNVILPYPISRQLSKRLF
jgi:hypothetical protein